MSPEYLRKWEHILEDVEKSKVPVQFIKKIIVKMVGKKQHTINIQALLKQGLEPEEVEEVEEVEEDEVEEDEGDEEKTVAIVIADRDSSKTVQDTAHFSNWKQLQDDVNLLIEDSGFRKVNVELTASWDTTDEDDDMIDEIEGG